MATYEMIFGTAQPNWLVGGLAILGLLWMATWAVRLWLWSCRMHAQRRMLERKRPYG